MEILLFLLASTLTIAIPGGLIAWFVISLVKYAKAPKDIRQSKIGMLVASAVTLGVVMTLGGWLLFTFMQDISFM